MTRESENELLLWGYIDTTRKTVISPQYDKAEEFSNGLAEVQNHDGADFDIAKF